MLADIIFISMGLGITAAFGLLVIITSWLDQDK